MRRFDVCLVVLVVFISLMTLASLNGTSWQYVATKDEEQNILEATTASTSNNNQTSQRQHHVLPIASTKIAAGDAPPPARMLLGIFTTNSTNEFTRRNLIRKTYLSTYKTFQEYDMEEGRVDRICPLADFFISGQDSDYSTTGNRTRIRTNSSLDDCRLVYAFVMGAADPSDTTAPTDLLELEERGNGTTVLYTLDRSGHENYERDVVYLNIRENMNDGKTVTWFKYASSILPSSIGIDLIAKVDSDTVVFPRLLLEELHETIEKQHHIPRPATKVYGGSNRVVREGAKVHYMQGGFYFLSRDVALAITSTTCPRAAITKRVVFDAGYRRSEDRETGHFVDVCANGDPDNNHNLTARTKHNDDKGGRVQQVVLSSDSSARHERIFKDANRFRVKWKDEFSYDMATLRYEEVRRKFSETKGCPPTKEALSKELAWVDILGKMDRVKKQFTKLLEAACSRR